MKKNNGIHLIGDLKNCDFDFFINKNSHDYLKNLFEEIIIKNGLNIVGSIIHTFPNNSFSLNIMLCESHVCIHTWPEENYISMDLFVCNYSQDNSLKAQKIYKEISHFFASKDEKLQIIYR